jgi:1-deoxy-D-xylulose-5-phosphate synthase
LGINLPILMLGLPDRFVDHGDHAQLLAAEGLDAPGIEKALIRRFPELFSERVPLRLAQAHA